MFVELNHLWVKMSTSAAKKPFPSYGYEEISEKRFDRRSHRHGLAPWVEWLSRVAWGLFWSFDFVAGSHVWARGICFWLRESVVCVEGERRNFA